jgi:hypothetical protein
MNINNWVYFKSKQVNPANFWLNSMFIFSCKKDFLSFFFICTSFFFLTSCNEVKYTQGQRIFNATCANCHMEDGSGLKNAIPSIQKSDYILGEKYRIVSLIVKGINADSLGTAEKYMPSHPKIKDVELVNLLNYLQEKFNNDLFEYKINDIKAEMQKIKS